jgi:hypothetical protein
VVVGRSGHIGVIDVIGGHVLEVAGHGIETEPAGGVDVTEPHSAGTGERAALHGSIFARPRQ